ncbi:MAG TPA: 50S ribosomal protein L11 methyltransferase [Anaerolineales bacterium]|nr:50S ribosomal protein L11 methyltransferase [Anaerolineales bacterium]
MRTSKVYAVLARAIVDAPFRESLFRNGRQTLEEWDLSDGEQAYLQELPYGSFEKMVGHLISHWLVPVTVNDRYVVLPERVGDYDTDEMIPLRLASSFAFGNGAHPTTALCLAALDEMIRPGFRVLDLGTGSGILSIAAALNDAGLVLSLDIDATSAAAAEENIRLNSVEKIVEVRQGSLTEALAVCHASGGFDLALVNILTPVVLSLLDDGLCEVLRPAGVLVCSGIVSGEVPMMKQTLRNAGLARFETKEKDGWAAVISQRPPISDKKR